MFGDEDQPRKKVPVPKDLSGLSVEELRDYIEALKAEIARAEGEIARKKASAEAAQLFFRKGQSE